MHASKLLLAACLAAAAAAPTALAQTHTYEAVTIKPAQPSAANAARSTGAPRYSPDGLSATNATVRTLIANAWNVKPADITGIPDSLTAPYDIEAKMDEATAAALAQLSPEQRIEQWRLMLQALLTSRFHLKLHPETKDAPIFALVVAKGGSKLEPIDPTKPQPGASASFGAGRFDYAFISTKGLANALAQRLQRPVEDRTGLTGNYKVSLRWQPQEGEPFFRPDLPDTGAPALPTALEEQLGLKLEPTRGLVQTIAVDHIEPPTPN